MAPFRNFLTRKSAPSGGESDNHDNSRLSVDNQQASPLSIRASSENAPNEFKLSVVDDNGDYLPPSPPEKQSFWRKYPGSPRSSNNHRDLVDDKEPFSISRESFDSYRRSFDISARSQVSYPDALPSRTSLDSRFSNLTSSSAVHTNGVQKPATMEEEEQFEDVGLDDEVKPKKKGIFTRFTNSSNIAPSSNNSKTSSSLGFHLPGRKQGQSGPGSELGSIKSPASTAADFDGV